MMTYLVKLATSTTHYLGKLAMEVRVYASKWVRHLMGGNR
jgi:hypothetical protein